MNTFWNLTQRIEPLFLLWLKELNLFLFLGGYDSKNSTFLFYEHDSKIFSKKKMWLKELKLFFTMPLELNLFFADDSKKWKLLIWIWPKKWTFFLEYDAKKWTLFFWIWLKDLNLFFLNMTQRLEPFSDTTQRIEPFSDTTQGIEPFSGTTQRHELFLLISLKELNPFFSDSNTWFF